MLAFLLLAALADDTLRIPVATARPVFDGRASEAEYGEPSVVIARAQGPVRIWLRRVDSAVVIAAQLPDSTFYWGDDLVISLDTRGDRAPAPMHDDFQWYFRRVLDSSVVLKGEAGRWRMPRDDPDWRLGAERSGGGWEVRGADDGHGWSLELRLDPAWFREAGNGLPAIAFRVYDNDPHGWDTWPQPPGLRQATELERRPALWVPVSP